MSEIVVCTNCGQKNRISANSNDSRAICAKCWTNLSSSVKTSKHQSAPPPPPPPSNKGNSGSAHSEDTNTKIIIAIFIVVAVLILAAYLGEKQSSKTDSIPQVGNTIKPVPQQPKIELPPEVKFPKSGQILSHTNKSRVAPLEIKTSRGSNYLVKLVSADNDEPVMTIYVHGGNTVTTEVPLGKYAIKYASGEKWYGYEELFGPDTEYSKANALFTFEYTGYQLSGYTITLYKVANGNLRTSRLSKSDF